MRSYSALAYCSRTVVGADDLVTDAASVKSVQAQLKFLSVGAKNTALDPGSINGVLGPRTRAAVAAFNSTYGWPDDGGSITRGGTLTALQRPDVVRLTQAGAGGSVAAIAMTDESVAARKDVVEQVKQADDAVRAAVDAKAAAVTPEQKQQAQAQADAAKKQADAVAVAAQQAPPDVKQAAAATQAAATATQVAQTPATIQIAQAKAAEAEKVVAALAPRWVPIALAAGGGAALGGLAGALLGWKAGAALLALGLAGVGALAAFAVPAALAKRSTV